MKQPSPNDHGSKPKTIRFGDLVRAAGRPHTLTLWTPPEKNRELQAAIKSNRVLTVERPNVGTKRDVGFVGFRTVREATYLIFPRSLEAESDQRVIGINYALIEEPEPEDPVKPAPVEGPRKNVHSPKSTRSITPEPRKS